MHRIAQEQPFARHFEDDSLSHERFLQLIEKAQRQLGYMPKLFKKEALIRNFRWYLDILSKFENASGVSHKVPWK